MKRMKSVPALLMALMLGIGMVPSSAAAAETESETEALMETVPESEEAEAETEIPEETGAESEAPGGTEVPEGIAYTAEPEEILIDTSDIDIPSADELFAGYVNTVFAIEDEERVLLEGRQAGGRLTGFNAVIYEKLRTAIEAVAAGERSSTEITISLSDLGLSGKTWTARELGVDWIYANGKINPDAVSAMDASSGIADIDFNAITDALMYDLPYDMYWYDKTVGIWRQTFGRGIIFYDEYEISYRGNMTFRFTVAEEYRTDKSDPEDFNVDTTTGQSVQKAKANADAIVKKYASKSDYEKLYAYKNEICSRAAYNTAAAANSSTPYGNPWQMIWVFDGDSSTTVVCEGYAKAFQYLCDQSSFDHSVIKCTAVSGTMSGGTGAGSHMWDIVSMNDGKNYLVDVTNCDAGTVGADDLLFLVGADSGSVTSGYGIDLPSRTMHYTYDSDMFVLYDSAMLTLAGSDYDPAYVCKHTHTSVVDKKSATCEEKGYTGDTVCSDCGEIISAGKETAALGHSWDSGKVTKAATCAAKGVKTYTCTRDASHTKTEEIPINAAAHSWGSWTVVKAATEEEEGLEERVCANDSSHKETRIVDKLTHVHWVQKVPARAATCTTDGNIEYYECSRCYKRFTTSACTKEIAAADTVIKATGHSWDSGKVTKAATCAAKGVKTYTCKNDSTHTKTEELPIDPKNHTGNTELRDAKAATTEEEGYTGDTYCKDCGAKLASGQKIDKLPKPAIRFDDVSDPSRYYYDPVYWAVEKGITNGYGGPNLFSPDVNCKREQIVTFLWRMMGQPKPKKYASFTDVKKTDWYYDSISWAAENNITVGLNDGTGRFGVGAPCTRAMCVTFFWRAAGQPKPKTDAGFTDAVKGKYYYQAVSWAAENKITVGLNDGTGRFGIDNYCSRAMIVTFLYRYAHLGK